MRPPTLSPEPILVTVVLMVLLRMPSARIVRVMKM
jgi:hypothetical protein